MTTFQVSMVRKPRPWFNIKMSSYQYRKSHCGDKTVVRSPYLHSGISYTGKMASFYWIRPLMLTFHGALSCVPPDAHKVCSTLVSVPCVKLQKDWRNETDVMDERDFAKFELTFEISVTISFGRISYIAQGPGSRSVQPCWHRGPNNCRFVSRLWSTVLRYVPIYYLGCLQCLWTKSYNGCKTKTNGKQIISGRVYGDIVCIV